VFKSCLGGAKSTIEQLRILEQVKDENRFFGRLWDKEISGSSADFITIGDICGACSAYYKQKMRTVLYCYKVHCKGDINVFIGKHGESGRMEDGAIVMNNFKTMGACGCGREVSVA
jgi:hypothetical protein